jgi:urease accessory protein
VIASPTPSGHAFLHVAKVRQRSVVLSSWSRTPLTILTPRASGESVWGYTSSFGGGMVAGDETRLDVQIDAGARCFLGTQASTKIYRNPNHRPCSHKLHARLAPGALLILAPDPIQCFAESSYEQSQTSDLADDANLVLVDWLSGGRTARGERWAFRRYVSRNQVRRAEKVVLHDALRLDEPGLENRFRTGRFNCLATVVLLGPELSGFSAEILRKIQEYPVSPNLDLINFGEPTPRGRNPADRWDYGRASSSRDSRPTQLCSATALRRPMVPKMVICIWPLVKSKS